MAVVFLLTLAGIAGLGHAQSTDMFSKYVNLLYVYI